MARRALPLVLISCILAAGCSQSSGSSGSSSTSGGTNPSGQPSLLSISPDTLAVASSSTLTVRGQGFASQDRIVLGGAALATQWLDAQTLSAPLPLLSSGDYAVQVEHNGQLAGTLWLHVGNSPPQLTMPHLWQLHEETEATLSVGAHDPEGDPVRVFMAGLPPGAIWDETSGQIRFRPDFIQGGKTYQVVVTADDGSSATVRNLQIEILDDITPPWPTVTNTVSASNHTRLTLSQTTDSWLDSPGHAGRSFGARVVIPDGASASQKMPVRVYLHGFGGSPYTGGAGGQYRIYAHDPSNTYWYGYGEQMPGGAPTAGTVPNYTQRRVLHLIEWLLQNHPGADPERVYVAGGSMGGAGAATLGLHYARHFCYVHATIGQKIARNHRPARLSQLAGFWGDPTLNLDDGRGMGVWDRLDLTRVLQELPEARDQFVYTKHGKDDGTIHFGAVIQPSPLTGLSFYQALQLERIGHYCVWDEGGHGSSDPVMGAGWWDDDWSRIFASDSYLRRDLPFPAFCQSSLDRDPGTGAGNGQQSWSTNSGYAGSVSNAGDTGWDGDLAGAINRFLRWDSAAIVDTPERLEMPLRAVDGTGTAAPQAGYPTQGDKPDGSLPIIADVSLRRVSGFRCLPGETVRWSFGALAGTVLADAEGLVTIPDLIIGSSWTTLVLTRN